MLRPDPLPSRLDRALAGLALLLLVTPGLSAQAGGGEAKDEATASKQPPVQLSEVRALFGRVDADGNARLSVTEADHGGIDGREHARFDHDGDRGLSLDEFVVAKRLMLARGGRAVAADLEAESTRVLALRRVRRERSNRAGPGRRVDERAARGARLQAGGSKPPTRTGRADEAAPAPARPTAGEGGIEAPTPAKSGPGLARLRRAAGRGAESSSVEDGAREAQRLLQQRLGTRVSAARTSARSSVTRSRPVPEPGPAARDKDVRSEVQVQKPAPQQAPGTSRARPKSDPAPVPAPGPKPQKSSGKEGRAGKPDQRPARERPGGGG